MPLDQKAVINQIDDLLQRYDAGLKRSQYSDLSDLPDQEAYEIVTLMAATIDRLAPPNSAYIEEAQDARENSTLGYRQEAMAGILRAMRSDYLAGNLRSVIELVHADVFADFLEMADYLLAQGYKDPAAVICGSVLEEHLRKMSTKHGISNHQGDRPKKADTLNADLRKAGAYSKLDQKSVTAWLDLRNKAAHGDYAGYTAEQVGLMVQASRDFIGRNPA